MGVNLTERKASEMHVRVHSKFKMEQRREDQESTDKPIRVALSFPSFYLQVKGNQMGSEDAR